MLNRARPLPLLLALAAGCGPSDEQVRGELMSFALSYHNVHVALERGPNTLDELLAIQPPLTSRSGGSLAVEWIRSGRLQVVWGARLDPDGDANDAFHLAYETTVPDEGGWVVRGGGFVEKLTAEEFAKLPPLPFAEKP